MTDSTLWHAIPAADALRERGTSIDGLSEDEARRRLATFGPNRASEIKGRGPVLRFLSQFNNVLIYVLLGAAVVTALLAHWLDTAVILGVVVINAVIGFIQE
ncbi:MAG: cation-transporting P-type ATPase, partial [Hyphomicrobiales bacterium]|nr:cation-transporting P-type ATPase [Hyphomicrobiales bacterium]